MVEANLRYDTKYINCTGAAVGGLPSRFQVPPRLGHSNLGLGHALLAQRNKQFHWFVVAHIAKKTLRGPSTE